MADTETLDDSTDAATDAENGSDETNAQSPLLEACRRPISEDAPCGEKVTYDEDFQQLKTQINSLESATGTPDYEQIVELGTTILAEKSKDLTTACYLALGLARQQGLEGVAEGIGATRVLVDTYWDDLYPAPRRMSGRSNALQFLADRLKDWLNDYDDDPPEGDRDALLQAQDDLGALQSFCIEEMDEHAPAFSGVRSALDRVVDRLPEPEPDEAESDEADSGEEETASTASASPSSSAAEDGAPQSASDAEQAVTRAAAFLREQDALDPTPYRLLRVLRWGVLRDDPPSENGQTRIQPPLEQRRTYLTGLLDEGEHETLIEEAEASFQRPPFHFWLDLQRLLAGALEALGDDYAPVRNAVLAETALLVGRLPDLPALTFSDGTPFADPLTRDWLENTVRPVLGEGQAASGDATGASPNDDDSGASLADQHLEAQQHLGSGNLQDALAAMRDGAARDTTQKDRFRRRLYVADLCVKGQNPAVARPLLERLDEEIDRHALDAWDPPLALEVWTNLHACYEALARSAPQSQKQELGRQADAMFEKICQVDPTRALSLDNS
jgi:type VI secretion system protein VasJ